MSNENWKAWSKNKAYAQVLYKRAIGESEEMESAKALCRVIAPLYKPGMRVLDIGCGAGHYLRSLKARLDPKIDYTGLDATEEHVVLARRAFGEKYTFVQGDIFDLPFPDASFDLVICCNVILHLPPPPQKALSELVRVSKDHAVVRTLVGERNYIIREIHTARDFEGVTAREGDLIRAGGEADSFGYNNLYTERYFRDSFETIDPRISVRIENDDQSAPFDNRKDCGSAATHFVNGRQVSGNILFDFKFIIASKPRQ